MNIFRSVVIFVCIFLIFITKKPLIIILLVILGFILNYFITSRNKRIRIKKIKDYCDKYLFVYEEHPISVTGKTEMYDIYKQGDNYEYFNSMYKKIEDYEINLIDFDSVEYFLEGKRRHTIQKHYWLNSIKCFTLCQIYNPKVLFPKFFLKKRRFLLDFFLSKMNPEIIFDEDKEFSDGYILLGAKELEIRDFFSEKVRNVFKNLKGDFLCESGENSILLYCKGYCSLEKRLLMMNTAMDIFKQIEQEGINYKIERRKKRYTKKFIPKKSPFENLGL